MTVTMPEDNTQLQIEKRHARDQAAVEKRWSGDSLAAWILLSLKAMEGDFWSEQGMWLAET